MKEYLIVEKENGLPLLKEYKDHHHDFDNLGFETVLNLVNVKYHLSELGCERLYLLGFSYKNEPLGIILISAGDYKGTFLYKRNIALGSLLMGAKKIILIHNHPGNNTEISEDDRSSSEEIRELCELIGIKYEGSIVFCRSGWIDLDDEELHDWRD